MKISFELLPAKSQNDFSQLVDMVRMLEVVKPTYFSIASGISGAPASMTLETTQFLSQHFQNKLVPHLTCGDKTKNDVIKLVDEYLELGINQLLILRGNFAPTGDFNYASDLVSFIREYINQPLYLGVAVDPNDLPYFKQKVAAGANGAITQFFYDIDAYARLLEDCQRLEINIPITPGVLPITDAAKTLRLAKQCGVKLPKNILLNLEKFAHDPLATLEYGIEVVTQLCQQLITMGAPALHFFTLNNPAPCLRILHEIK